MTTVIQVLIFIVWSFLSWGVDPTQTALTPKEFERVGIDQSVLGSQLSTNLEFVDEKGNRKQLKSFFLQGKPSLISIVYYNCPGLCGLHMNGAATLFKEFSLKAGKDFNWITITMDATETHDLALKKKLSYINQFKVKGASAGWKFLTSDEENIKKITKEMGFSFKWDEKTKQFAHSAAFYVITSKGEISQIIPGIGFDEQTVRLSLVQAAGGSIGTVIDQILLFCYQFDPTKNKYGLYAFNLMRIAGALTVLVLGIILIPLWKKESSRGGNT